MIGEIGDRITLRADKTPDGFTKHASRSGLVVESSERGCLVAHDAPWWRFWNRRPVGPYGWSWSELERP